MQLMTGVVPSLQALQREGEYGRTKINQYTRYLSVPMALLQAYGILALLSANNVLTTPFDLGSWETITQIVTLTAGSVTLMWLGELITEKGIGNGISFIIFAGIVSRAPGALTAFINSPDLARFVLFAILGVAAVAVIIYIQEGQRRIPIQYASRVRGRRMYQGGQTFLPLRVNQAGVIPIIFAVSILLFPSQIASYFVNAGGIVGDIANGIVTWLSRGSWLYVALYFLLTVGFTYFYTAFTFKPDETAEQLRKNGGFIPGIRPGRPTQDYLAKVVTRITVAGALFLGIVAALPPFIALDPAAVPEPRAGRHGHPDRGLGRRRDDEAGRGPAAHPPVRRLHQMRPAAWGSMRASALTPRPRRLTWTSSSFSAPPAPGRGRRRRCSPTRLGVPIVATGDLFRAAVRDGTPLGIEARRYMDAGQLVPDEITVRLLLDRLARADADGGVILDGFPRTDVQARGARRRPRRAATPRSASPSSSTSRPRS